MANPYANLRSLLDTTRQLNPEEMAELQLEQGYVERALAIYEHLVTQHPANDAYRRRRDWLRRLDAVQARPVKKVEGARRAGVRAVPSVDMTLRGALPPQLQATPPDAAEDPEPPEEQTRVRRTTPSPRVAALRIVEID